MSRNNRARSQGNSPCSCTAFEAPIAAKVTGMVKV